jgi:hypothetical protein
MRLTPSGIASTFEVLVALADLDASAPFSAFVLPVNVLDVIVVEVELGTAAGAALTVGGVVSGGAAGGTATGANATAATGGATIGAAVATGNGVTLLVLDGATAAASYDGISSSGRLRSNASASDGVCAGVLAVDVVPAGDGDATFIPAGFRAGASKFRSPLLLTGGNARNRCV